MEQFAIYARMDKSTFDMMWLKFKSVKQQLSTTYN